MKAVWAEEGDVQIFRDRLLGRGGFGEVFRGRFRGADVAVKLLHASLDEQDAKAMFEAELKMWIDVPRHDNLVHLLAYRTAPTFLVTELCNGGSLKSFLAAKGWPKPLSIRMLAHAATGIALLHSLGIVHSDLKADNVLVALDASGNPVGRIADFGISKIRTRIEDSHGNKEYQYRGLQGATVRFAPPEFFDHAPMGRQADVWTFGMMCYQVLSGGHDPYSDLTSPAAVSRLLAIFGGKRPACPGGVSSGVWALVESCWAEEPADRPVMADIARELLLHRCAAYRFRLRIRKMVDKMDETLSTTMPSDTDLFLFKESQVSLGKQIGEGGYGVVYVGTYNGTDTVAVKKLHVARLSNQLKAVFEKELAVWRSLPAHENIMPLLGYCYEPPMLLAQLADGGNLNDYLDAKNWDQALGITCLYGVAVGMNFLHGKNVFHGDLKSYNVLVHRGIPKIADFGLAQLRARTTAVTTKAGQGVGTVRWMAPELFETGLQKPADVYAYAMTCYEVLSEGGFPFMDVGSNDAVGDHPLWHLTPANSRGRSLLGRCFVVAEHAWCRSSTGC
ncbi:kinase-like domain-containing protein [Hyaloraphidium curvatum]|nr:kinase-like domain-containing protein [Hyaloraphidium curvatum]